MRLMEAVFAWARDVGRDLDELTPEQRKGILQMFVEEVIVDRNDNADITLAIPIESEPTTEDSVSVQTLESVQTQEPSLSGLNRHGKLNYSWAVGLGPFKLGRIARQQRAPQPPAGEGGAIGNGRRARPSEHTEAG